MHSPGRTNLRRAVHRIWFWHQPTTTGFQKLSKCLPVVVTSLAPISERFCRTDKTSFFLSSDLVASWSASWLLVMALAAFMALDFIADFIAGGMSSKWISGRVSKAV